MPVANMDQTQPNVVNVRNGPSRGRSRSISRSRSRSRSPSAARESLDALALVGGARSCFEPRALGRAGADSSSPFARRRCPQAESLARSEGQSIAAARSELMLSRRRKLLAHRRLADLGGSEPVPQPRPSPHRWSTEALAPADRRSPAGSAGGRGRADHPRWFVRRLSQSDDRCVRRAVRDVEL